MASWKQGTLTEEARIKKDNQTYDSHQYVVHMTACKYYRTVTYEYSNRPWNAVITAVNGERRHLRTDTTTREGNRGRVLS